ncbi:Quinolinate synthase A [Desulfovibrionales bacterium]
MAPTSILTLTPPADKIVSSRTQLGANLTILGHHYQHDAVIQYTDLHGDSLELARRIPSLAARYIVFCGVFFMAESAALLIEHPDQQIYTPRPDATCVMSEMAPAPLVETIIRALTARGRQIIPIAYVNSSAAVKATVGRYGGAVCTSANAITMLRWALNYGQGHGVLFLPDKNLAANMANRLGLPNTTRHILDVRSNGNYIDLTAADAAEFIIWPGCCAIHSRFHLHHVETARQASPDARIIVHPECRPEVVAAADASGSTSFLIEDCTQAQSGSHLIIGTEINLIERLNRKLAHNKRIEPLYHSECSSMAKTTELHLANLLGQLVNAPHTVSPIMVPPAIADLARLALQRMLDACA